MTKELDQITQRHGWQVRSVADPSERVRAWVVGIKQSEYIVVTQYYSPSAGRWVSLPRPY